MSLLALGLPWGLETLKLEQSSNPDGPGPCAPWLWKGSPAGPLIWLTFFEHLPPARGWCKPGRKSVLKETLKGAKPQTAFIELAFCRDRQTKIYGSELDNVLAGWLGGAWKQPRCPSADEWIRKLWYIYTMEYYWAIKKNTFESVLMKWIKLEPIIQSEVSQKDKYQYSILTHIYGIYKDGNDNPICKTEKETQMYRTDFWTLWEKARVGWYEK